MPDDPRATYTPDTYRFEWDDAEIIFDRLREGRDHALTAEVIINTALPPTPGLLHHATLNLTSTTTRKALCATLKDQAPDIDWYVLIETACHLSLTRWREGEEVVDLAQVPYEGRLPYLLPPIVLASAPTVLFGEGGLGKSMLALFWSLNVPCKVLYLDWEWEPSEHAQRMRALCDGNPPRDKVFYRRETASLPEASAAIRRRIGELGIGMVVIDSLGLARGGEPENAEVTLRLFTAIRSLGVPALCLDHMTKDAKDKKHSFGSIYTYNSARMVWRLDAVKAADGNTDLALTNTKANGRYEKRQGYHMRVDSDDDGMLASIEFESCDPLSLDGLITSMKRRDQIASAIKAAGRAISVEDIRQILADEGVVVSHANIRAQLNRHKGGMFNQTGIDGGEILWGMAAHADV